MRRAQGTALEQQQETIQGRETATKLGTEGLRREIVVIEDEAHAQRAVEQGEQEEKIGRIAPMDGVEPALTADLDGEAQATEQRHPILVDVGQRAGGRRRQRVAINGDAVNSRMVLGVTLLAARANDG